MPGRTEYFAKVASDAARDLTRSVQTWTGFLTTVGRLYRYSYPDQRRIPPRTASSPTSSTL